MLCSPVDAGDSMVCGKPSIRDVLKRDTADVNEQMWMSIQKTAEDNMGLMARDVERKEEELKELEAQAKAKEGEAQPTKVQGDELNTLLGKAFGGDANFADAAEAAKYDCGYGMNVPFDQMDHYAEAFETAMAKFATESKKELKDAGKAIQKTTFSKACLALLPGDTCASLCDEFGISASENSATGAVSLGSPTYNELLVMITAKREEKKQAEGVHKECKESVATITRLRGVFVKNQKKVTESTRAVGGVVRRLKMRQNMLRRVMITFHEKTEEDRKARAALAEAIKQEENARIAKEEAAETLRLWEEHMAALLKAIEAQKIVVRQTEEALRAAEAASRVVVEFKNKLSTALNALVDYYDEAVRQPLRVMGIREEVAIASLFPAVSDTEPAGNLKDSLDKTKVFCTSKKATLSTEAVADIEADGAKLPALCESQDWSVVAGEVVTAVSTRQQRAIKNLEDAQKKVVSYSGATASKSDGEVEGVWKAVAIFGNTDFAKSYLSGWKFDGTTAKGTTAGFMMELAKALDSAREKAAKLFEEAKKELKTLEDEKEQVEEVLKVAREYLQEMIVEYEKAVKNREEKQELARKAKEALDIITARKEQLEAQIGELVAEKKGLEDAVTDANAKMKETHDEALGKFMELLHASEQHGSESWD